MGNNKKYMYFALLLSILGFAFLFGLIFLVVNRDDNEESISNKNEYKYEYIEIQNIDDYPACMIMNHKPYYLFEEITVEHSILENKITITNSEFNKSKDNQYKDINGAVYNFNEGYNIYSIDDKDIFVVDYNYGLGDSLFVSDYDSYKKLYDLSNKTGENVVLYKDINDFESSTKIESFDSFSETKTEPGDDFNEGIVVITEDIYNYIYFAKYNDNGELYIYDYINNIILEGNI